MGTEPDLESGDASTGREPAGSEREDTNGHRDADDGEATHGPEFVGRIRRSSPQERPGSAATIRPLPSPVAQLAEHPAVNRRVVGSSPTRGVRKAPQTRGFLGEKGGYEPCTGSRSRADGAIGSGGDERGSGSDPRHRIRTTVCRNAEVPAVRANRGHQRPPDQPAPWLEGGGSDRAQARAQQAARVHGEAVRAVHQRQGGRRRPTDAKLVDASVRIFTNTTGRPLYANVDGKVTPTVLGSYGLFVNTAGMLHEPREHGRTDEEGERRPRAGRVLGQVVQAERRPGFASDALPVGLHL